jgi:hypothetical protein
MTTAFFCIGAFVVCFAAASRSLRLGLLATIAVGYLYGILRANFPDTWTYLTFDAAALGLYAAQLWQPLTLDQRLRAHDLRLWIVVLIAWPTLLFFVFPTDTPLVELVGLRANIFMLPFLFLGARLDSDDLFWLAKSLAVLNLGAVAIAMMEFSVGIEAFYPRNEVTELVYKSKDLVGWTAHRIPSTFANAHAFAGTMVMTLPLLIGAWVQPRTTGWMRRILAAAVIASLVGVFMAAARTHMITAALLVAVVTFSGSLRRDQWLRWAVAIALVGYVIAGEQRLQRFTTLQETGFIAQRWNNSVNAGFFELVTSYPLGNGLTGGGTSVPYFLRDQMGPVVAGLENEYARIGLEQGLPGLTLWVVFLLWVFTRFPWRMKDEWSLGRRLAWITAGVAFFSGMTGTGLLISVPQTCLMLLSVGWFVVAIRPRNAYVWRTRKVEIPATDDVVEPASNA